MILMSREVSSRLGGGVRASKGIYAMLFPSGWIKSTSCSNDHLLNGRSCAEAMTVSKIERIKEMKTWMRKMNVPGWDPIKG